MANQEVVHPGVPQVRPSRVSVSGSLAEGISGGAAAILAIIGLAGFIQVIMAAVATLAIGAALLSEGGSVTARLSALLSQARVFERDNVGVGVTVEMIGGLAGIVLGILALINIAPMVLIPSAVVAFGGTMLFSSGIISSLNTMDIAASEEPEPFKQVAEDAVAAATGVQMLIGLAAITLGILALTDIQPVILSLVALLTVGFSDFVTGTAVSARLATVFRK